MKQCKTYFFLLFLLFTPFISGCVGCLGLSTISAPVPDETPQINPDDKVLYLDDISISICVDNQTDNFGFGTICCIPVTPPVINFSNKPNAWNRNCMVTIKFDAKDKLFTFNPSQVFLLVKDKEYTPSAVQGPFRKSTDYPTRACPGHNWDCPVIREDKFKPINLSESFMFNGKVCFALQFPVLTLHPAENFKIKIKGLEKDDKEICIPAIMFSPSRTLTGETLG